MILLPAAIALAVAIAVYPLRRRLRVAGPLAVLALVAAFAAVAASEPGTEETVAGLALRVTALGRTMDLVFLGLLILATIYVALAEPAYNFIPVALFTAAAAHAVLALQEGLPLFLVLLVALIVPVLAFTFRVRENRSVEASVRHFGIVVIGGSLGVAALALVAHEATVAADRPLAVTLLLVLLVVAFAMLLGVLPFHGHLAFLTSEAPPASLALLFGVLVPLTLVAFLSLLATSGVLPAIAAVATAQTLLFGLGLTSALGGALLAIGAPDLRRLSAYSAVSNVGIALIGVATFSGPGIVGGVAVMLVTGVAVAQQFLSAGALVRAMEPEDLRPAARRAPLAAATFVLASLAIVGMPPLAGFPGRFLVEQIAFAVSLPVGLATLLATLGLLVAHLRAGLGLFSEPPPSWRPERRPVAGVVGLVLLGALLAGGLYPDPLLEPIGEFAREFLTALRPLAIP